MSVQLNQVIPWGRSFREYELMFGLSVRDLEGRIFGCADGPASFNAELTQRGGAGVSCDPVYAFSGADIEQRFEASVDQVIMQVEQKLENYVWHYHRSPDELKQYRRRVLKTFLGDYTAGREAGRYLV